MPATQAFLDHVQSGLTTLARCWKLTRRDGWSRGFTDHDADILFGGQTYKADTGLTAHAIMQTTGLSIDNSEAVGALSDASLRDRDVEAGRFDGANVEAWLVNWANPEERSLQFRGNLGEITRSGGAFRAELLGLAEGLNRVQGRVYQSDCSAILGDGRCRFDLATPGFFEDLAVASTDDSTSFILTGGREHPNRWFERGRVRVLDGSGAGLSGVVKNDAKHPDGRRIELWQALREEIVPGDRLRLEAGCDKQSLTCRMKFDNMINFRGFPDIPGEDRLLSVPVSGETVDTTGGSGSK